MSDDDGIQAWAPIEVVEGLLKRAEQAEAAIARVRKVCERIQTDTYDLRPDSREALRAHERLAVAHLILRALDGAARCILDALDGGCPTCEGPIRETVGLVCQTCGTDYGAQGDRR